MELAGAIASEAKTAIPGLALGGLVATGPAWVGTLGCADMRRPAAEGGVFEGVDMLLTFGWMQGYQWLVNEAASKGCLDDHLLRMVLDTPVLVPEARRMREGTGADAAPEIFYELLRDDEEVPGGSEVPSSAHGSSSCPQYSSASTLPVWRAYNEAGLQWVLKRDVDAACREIDSHEFASPALSAFFRTRLAAALQVDFSPRVRAADIGHLPPPSLAASSEKGSSRHNGEFSVLPM
eukprot:TRINITY_DN9008_c0_g2_i1.p1 TRINITY_DN9008_c0_g2~~TRINITY_DN9008_c0_g2_i1.p1  ORF type:complete len:261 (+),score=56.43 TRINITY_DN9008_c0_g2_i1:76-783(+)